MEITINSNWNVSGLMGTALLAETNSKANETSAVNTERMDTVSISEEGRKLAESQQSASDLYDYKENLKKTAANYAPESDPDLEEKRMAAKEELRRLKELDDEEYRRKLEETRQQQSKETWSHDNMRKNMCDLYVMLKSFTEDDPQDKKNKENDSESDSLQENHYSIGNAVEQYAAYAVTATANKEVHAENSVNQMMTSGHAMLSDGNELLKQYLGRADDALKILSDGNLSEEAQAKEYSMVYSQDMKQLEDTISLGKQKVIYAKQLDIERQGVSAMTDVSATADALLDTANVAYLSEQIHEAVSAQEDALAERVQNELDERNEQTEDVLPEIQTNEDETEDDTVKE